MIYLTELLVLSNFLSLALAANLESRHFSSGNGSVVDIDFTNNQTNHRIKRYALSGFKWPMTNLTYKILNYSDRFRNEKDKLEDVIKRAFDTWANVSRLSFRQIKSEIVGANINIQFGKEPYSEMPDGLLADFKLPTNKTLKSYFYLNNNRDWVLEESNNTSLLSVALHEIGHLLGLSHSYVPEAKMSPIDNGAQHLHADDVAAIRALYGEERIKR